MQIMTKRRRVRGQTLVEYALVLVLVALAAIVILSLVGMAVSRGYALVAGVLGVEKSDPNAAASTEDAIDIEQASCFVFSDGSPAQVVVSLNVSSGIGADDLTLSTAQGFLDGPITGSNPSFSQNTTINGIDSSACPLTVVVQSRRTTAIKQVTITPM